MKYKPEDKIFTIQAQAHTSVLRTVHGKIRVQPAKNRISGRLSMAAIFPILLLASIHVLSSATPAVTIEDDTLHGAAETLSDTIEEQKLVREYYCNEVCSKPVETDLVQEACLSVCGVRPNRVIRSTRIDLQTTQPIVERTVLSQSVRSTSVPEITKENQKMVSNHMAMYLTASNASNTEYVDAVMQKVQENGGNALVIDVKGSYVYFPTDAEVANELQTVRPIVDLPALVQKAHEMGIYVIGRYIAVKDPTLATRAPETQILNIYSGKGIGSVWVTANHPTTMAYNKGILEDLVDTGIDEINFDYIRYPTEYNQAAIALSGPEKAEKLLEFLRMARDIVDAKQADTKLGVSTFAILGWNFPINFEPLGQDIAAFGELVDVVSPMVYPSTFAVGYYYNPAKHQGSRNYYLVHRTLTGYKELLGENSWKLRPWIQGYYMTQKGLEDQMQAVFDADLCGFMVWNAQNNYGNAYKAMLAKKDAKSDACKS